jgi:hypothetical protein
MEFYYLEDGGGKGVALNKEFEKRFRLSVSFYTASRARKLAVSSLSVIANDDFILLWHSLPWTLQEAYKLQHCYGMTDFKFQVCKSVHHCTIQINHQPYATIFQFVILTFIYSSTCFGYRGDSRVVFVFGPIGPTTNIARLSPLYKGKTRSCRCSHWAPDDGRENARNVLNCK